MKSVRAKRVSDFYNKHEIKINALLGIIESLRNEVENDNAIPPKEKKDFFFGMLNGAAESIWEE
jgi:hypothetical protein